MLSDALYWFWFKPNFNVVLNSGYCFWEVYFRTIPIQHKQAKSIFKNFLAAEIPYYYLKY